MKRNEDKLKETPGIRDSTGEHGLGSGQGFAMAGPQDACH